ncbi:MAG: hypothetical protein ABFQ62_05480 [Patescibacteria group bacterium]
MNSSENKPVNKPVIIEGVNASELAYADHGKEQHAARATQEIKLQERLYFFSNRFFKETKTPAELIVLPINTLIEQLQKDISNFWKENKLPEDEAIYVDFVNVIIGSLVKELFRLRENNDIASGSAPWLEEIKPSIKLPFQKAA